MSRSYEIHHFAGAGNESREASCVAYFARFCERAKAEMVSAEGVRALIRAERNPQRPPKDRANTRNQPGTGINFHNSAVKGMFVTEHVLEVARRWAKVDIATRRREKGSLVRVAQEAGVSVSTIKKLDGLIRNGKL
jgi:hypothetical protein